MKPGSKSGIRAVAICGAIMFFSSASSSFAGDYFFEDFADSKLDATNWNTTHATSGMRWCSSALPEHLTVTGQWIDASTTPCNYGGIQYGPYGFVNIDSTANPNYASFSAAPGSWTFPYLFAGPGNPKSPFPATGDFSFEVRMKYDHLDSHGNGVNLTGWSDPTPLGDNPPIPANQSVFGIWGDGGGVRTGSNGTANTELGYDTNWHTYRLTYIAGTYTLYVDGEPRGTPYASDVRPATVWIGNPVITFWGTPPWSSFSIDYIRVSVPQIDVSLDIKPGSCPSPFNVKQAGVLPAAVLGSNAFDVTQIDLGSIRLEGVAPLRSNIEDVATPSAPVIGKTVATDCTAAGADGFPDLTVKFDAQSVARALGTVADGDLRVLRLTGTLKPEFGGAAIGGEDIVVVIKK